jgi:hypothetical protein
MTGKERGIDRSLDERAIDRLVESLLAMFADRAIEVALRQSAEAEGDVRMTWMLICQKLEAAAHP